MNHPSGQKEPEKNNTRPSRPDASPKPTEGRHAPPDLDELWHQFNHRLNHLFRRRPDPSKGNPAPSSGRGRLRARTAIGLGCGLLLAAWLSSGLYIVRPNQVAVVWQFGAYHATKQPGIQWRLPFPLQALEFVDVSTRTVEIKANQAEGPPHQIGSWAFTRDAGLVDAHFAVHYRIADVRAFLFNYAEARSTLIQAGQAAACETFGTLTTEDTLIQKPVEFESKLLQKMQDILDLSGTGIHVSGVTLRPAHLPSAARTAFEEAVKVAQEQSRQKNETQAAAQQIKIEARVKAQHIVDKAKRYKARTVAAARGESARFNQILAEYLNAPEVTRERMYLDTMQRIYSQSTKILANGKTAQQFILPLEKLQTLNQPPPSTAPRKETPAPPALSMQEKDAVSAVKDAKLRAREALRSRERINRTRIKD